MFTFCNDDNMTVIPENKFKLVYCDMIYENDNLAFIPHWWQFLENNGIFIVQTDYHTSAQVKLLLDSMGKFVNWCIYVNDWGGTPRKGFPNKHDDILIYCKGDDFYWDKSGIEIEKSTKNTAFDKKGTGLKTPPDVFYDHASFSTMSKERVRFGEHNIKWQKPMWLMDRLCRPFTKRGDTIADPFMGSGTLALWCYENGREYFGVELDKEIYDLAYERVMDASHSKR